MGANLNPNLNNINDRLIAAVLSGDKAGLVKILSSEKSLANWSDKAGVTILMIAAMASNAEIIDCLISSMAKVDKTDDSGNSALMYAISYSNVQAAAALIKKGANVYLKDRSGLAAAELAELYSQKEIAALIAGKPSKSQTVLKPEGGKYIYNSDARQNASFIAGVFSFIITILKYGFVMLLFLIAIGIYVSKNEGQIEPYPSMQSAKKSQSAQAKKTPARPAAKKNRLAVNSMLIEYIKNSDAKSAQNLIESGIFDLNAMDSSSMTPLMHAAKKGFPDLVKLLIDKGAAMESVDVMGNTALFYAIEGGFTGVVQMLLEKGANYEHSNFSNIKPLIHASKDGNCDIIRLLINRGANVNAETGYRDTALTWAVYNGHYEAVKMLIESGADINITTLHGDTPFTLAQKQGRDKIYELLSRAKK